MITFKKNSLVNEKPQIHIYLYIDINFDEMNLGML